MDAHPSPPPSLRWRVAMFGLSHGPGVVLWSAFIVIPTLLLTAFGLTAAVAFIVLGLIGVVFEPAANLVEAMMSSAKEPAPWQEIGAKMVIGSVLFGLISAVAWQLAMRLLWCLAPKMWIAGLSLLSVTGRIVVPSALAWMFWESMQGGATLISPVVPVLLLGTIGLAAEWWLIQQLDLSSASQMRSKASFQPEEPIDLVVDGSTAIGPGQQFSAGRPNRPVFLTRVASITKEHWWIIVLPVASVLARDGRFDLLAIAHAFVVFIGIFIVYLQLFHLGSWRWMAARPIDC